MEPLASQAVLFGDFHFHSRYSRAVSQEMNLEGLSLGARVKGLNLLGTGDFSHPIWFQELKSKLVELEAQPGILKLRNPPKGGEGILFTLTNEVATFLSTPKGVKKVHHIIHAPSLEVVEQLNEVFSKMGKLAADGRPMFASTSSAELVEKIMSVSKENLVYPAHCLPPDELVFTPKGPEKISHLRQGDFVFTHKGRSKAVTKILSREYSGQLIELYPFYFSEGLSLTPEHPVFAIKTVKNCAGTKGPCKPTPSHLKYCWRHWFEKYEAGWIPAGQLAEGDVLVYPRFAYVEDRRTTRLSEFSRLNVLAGVVQRTASRSVEVPDEVQVSKDFCRLAGYYLAEGSVSLGNQIQFNFGLQEAAYAFEVAQLLGSVFGFEYVKVKKRVERGAIEVCCFSKSITPLFEKMFYSEGMEKRAYNKRLPDWFLALPAEKQKELVRGWWRGDKGSTTSPVLAMQMQIMFLRLGIIPSTYVHKASEHNRYGHRLQGRKIVARHDIFVMNNLSFFDSKDLLEDPAFSKYKTKRETRHGWIDSSNVYLPIRKIARRDYSGPVYNLEVEEDNSYACPAAAVHNCWTPHFGALGSISGYDSLDECYEDQAKNIFALETGMSADPSLCWRVSKLDKFALISNSDSHSNHPWRLGRECNAFAFSNEEVSYKKVFEAIKNKDSEKFLFTVETFPEYGKYHVDGHRLCNFSCSPEHSRKLKERCPKCGRRLTIGVLNRVEQLADRPEGFVLSKAIPFKKLLPLHELLAAVFSANVYSKRVAEEAQKLLSVFRTELNVLLNSPLEELLKTTHEKISEIILLNREGKLEITPGYDGEYGKLVLKPEYLLVRKRNKENQEREKKGQKTLAEF